MNLNIFLDLKKAFDVVDHNILAKKLNSYCVVDRTGGWFESYRGKSHVVYHRDLAWGPFYL